MITCKISFFTSVGSTRGDKRANTERVTKFEHYTPSLYEVETAFGRETAQCYVRQYSSHICQPQPLTYYSFVHSFIHSFIRSDRRHIYSTATVVMMDERMQILSNLMNHTRRPEYIQHISAMLVGAVSLEGRYCMRNGL